jgi:hypothetical protein
LVADRGKRLVWCSDESTAQIFVGHDLPDEQLHGSL